MFKPTFTVTPLILSNISEISEIKAIVERSRVLPLNEANLRREAIVKMAHTSTSIEGNKLAEFEVGKVLKGDKVRALSKDVAEVENYYKALQKINELAKKNSPISLSEVLEVHKIVIEGLVEKEKVGEFRPSDVYVVDEDHGKQTLRFKAPDAKKVKSMVEDLLEWLKQSETIHPVLRAAIFHLEFVSIHPFTDGNGRLARLLTQLCFYRSGWDFRKILVLEDYYNRNRLSYYDAEHVVQGNSYNTDMNFTSWIEYFTFGFLVEARAVLEKVKSIDFGGKGRSNEQVFIDSDETKILDFLTTLGRVTSDDVTDILKIAKRTAQLKLKTLTRKKMIESQGSGPSTYYILAR